MKREFPLFEIHRNSYDIENMVDSFNSAEKQLDLLFVCVSACPEVFDYFQNAFKLFCSKYGFGICEQH